MSIPVTLTKVYQREKISVAWPWPKRRPGPGSKSQYGDSMCKNKEIQQ